MTFTPSASAETPLVATATTAAVALDRVSFAFDDQVVLRDLSFRVEHGSMAILLGASGSGKSVLLKLILGLLRPDTGEISVNGQRIDTMREAELMGARANIGMMFQENALFDSLTVGENVGYRLSEETDTPADEVARRVLEVARIVGLEEFLDRAPSALSGGQRRRVALARAMAARPQLLLLDDPTSGLDPVTATTVDDQIVVLRDVEQVTSIVVTHQIRDAYHIATHRAVAGRDGVRIEPMADDPGATVRFLVLYEGRICFEGSAAELRASRDAYLKEFLFMTLPPW